MSDMTASSTVLASPASFGGGAPPLTTHHSLLTTQQVGLLSFLVSEVALFGTLIVTYLVYLGNDVMGGPTPAQVLSLSLALCSTACLLASSGTVHVAEKALERGNRRGFLLWWLATIILGVLFLGGTAYEWYGMIVDYGLTISRNLFGTTYYTLVGLHALHVTGGVTIMLVVLGLALGGARGERQEARGEQVPSSLSPLTPHPSPLAVGLVSWYWHFVDGVWVVVFTVVYLIGR